MKTAVEFLVHMYALQGVIYQYDIDKAIEMEKEHIINAYKADLHPCSNEDAEQYYNETFKQDQ